MIRSFACGKTALFFEERKTRSFSPDIQRVALRKLAQLHAVTELNHLSVQPATASKLSRAIGKANTPAASMTNGASVSSGNRTDRMRWKSSIITESTLKTHAPIHHQALKSKKDSLERGERAPSRVFRVEKGPDGTFCKRR